jgi:hypothetical protein
VKRPRYLPSRFFPGPEITNNEHLLGTGRVGFGLSLRLGHTLVKGSRQDWRRVFGAWVCLLAAAVLYAPLGGAAWASRAMACCTADHCNIPEHHHQKASPHPASDMNCGHDMPGMSECSMSCCQNPERQVVTAMLFVLPPLTSAWAPMQITGDVTFSGFPELPRFIQPLLQPPRVAAAAL